MRLHPALKENKTSSDMPSANGGSMCFVLRCVCCVCCACALLDFLPFFKRHCFFDVNAYLQGLRHARNADAVCTSSWIQA